jgi:hypothetical protein
MMIVPTQLVLWDRSPVHLPAPVPKFPLNEHSLAEILHLKLPARALVSGGFNPEQCRSCVPKPHLDGSANAVFVNGIAATIPPDAIIMVITKTVFIFINISNKYFYLKEFLTNVGSNSTLFELLQSSSYKCKLISE